MARGVSTQSKDTQRLTMLLILSDGEPTDSINPDKRISLLKDQLRTLELQHATQTIVSCFGYGRNVASGILQSLVSTGTFCSGMYYSLNSEVDIGVATGDCLGGLNQISVVNVQVSAQVFDLPTRQLLPHIPCYVFGNDMRTIEDMSGISREESTNQVTIPMLTRNQVFSTLFVIPNSALASNASPVGLQLTCTYHSRGIQISQTHTSPIALPAAPADLHDQMPIEPQEGQGEGEPASSAAVPLASVQGWAGVEEGEVLPSLSPSDLHTLVHIVRIQTSLAIIRATTGAVDQESLQLFHDFLLKVRSFD